MAHKPQIGTLSINEFAKRMGVTPKAVVKAIDAKKIYGEAIGGTERSPRIIEELARKQWADNYAPPRGTKSVKLEEALFGKGTFEHTLPPIDENAAPQDEDDSDVIKIGKRAPLSEAKRVEAIHRAKIAELDLRERKSELIEKAKADREYYAAGQIVRSALQSIPDKHIDNILACSTRMEAHALLTAAIIEALESLSKTVEV